MAFLSEAVSYLLPFVHVHVLSQPSPFIDFVVVKDDDNTKHRSLCY